jgi:hypothetical protein
MHTAYYPFLKQASGGNSPRLPLLNSNINCAEKSTKHSFVESAAWSGVKVEPRFVGESVVVMAQGGPQSA